MHPNLVKKYADLKAMVLTRERKLKLILLWQTVMFDLRFGTETRVEVGKDKISADSASLPHGHIYAASWTRELKKTFNILSAKLNGEMKNYAFVDVGSGKGKVVILWKMLCRQHGVTQHIVGIEYDKRINDIARLNFKKVFKSNGDFRDADAAEFDFSKIGRKLIVYMFNPFNDVVMKQVLSALLNTEAIIVYNNPDFDQLILQSGWQEFHRRVGVWGFNRTVMYARSLERSEKLSPHREN